MKLAFNSENFSTTSKWTERDINMAFKKTFKKIEIDYDPKWFGMCGKVTFVKNPNLSGFISSLQTWNLVLYYKGLHSFFFI